MAWAQGGFWKEGEGALVTPYAEIGTACGLEAAGILHPPGKGTRDTPESGPIIQSGPKRDMEGPRALRSGHPGRPHDRVQAFQGPSRKPGPDQPVWPSQLWQDPLPSTQGLALKRPCRTLDTAKRGPPAVPSPGMELRVGGQR